MLKNGLFKDYDMHSKISSVKSVTQTVELHNLIWQKEGCGSVLSTLLVVRMIFTNQTTAHHISSSLRCINHVFLSSTLNYVFLISGKTSRWSSSREDFGLMANEYLNSYSILSLCKLVLFYIGFHHMSLKSFLNVIGRCSQIILWRIFILKSSVGKCLMTPFYH